MTGEKFSPHQMIAKIIALVDLTLRLLGYNIADLPHNIINVFQLNSSHPNADKIGKFKTVQGITSIL